MYTNIHFHDEIRKFPQNIPKYFFFFLELLEEFPMTQKRVQIRHGKQAISVK